MYILEVIQNERVHKIGLFKGEADIIEWLDLIPFIKRTDYEGEIDYTLDYESIPDWYEVDYHNHIYPLTKYMFEPGGEIYFVWEELVDFTQQAAEPTLKKGYTQVDAFLYPTDQAEAYIKNRNALFNDLVRHFNESEVVRVGVGSEDGEYVLVDREFFIHLDAPTIDEWVKAQDKTAWINAQK